MHITTSYCGACRILAQAHVHECRSTASKSSCRALCGVTYLFCRRQVLFQGLGISDVGHLGGRQRGWHLWLQGKHTTWKVRSTGQLLKCQKRNSDGSYATCKQTCASYRSAEHAAMNPYVHWTCPRLHRHEHVCGDAHTSREIGGSATSCTIAVVSQPHTFVRLNVALLAFTTCRSASHLAPPPAPSPAWLSIFASC